MMRQAVVVLLLTLTACTGNVDGESDIIGVWEMVSFIDSGVETTVTEDVNTARIPYVEFGETSYGGVGGCNGFGSDSEGYAFDGETLVPGDPIFEASLCVPESFMTAENALVEMLWSRGPIAVVFDGDSMIWNQGSRRIEWRAIEAVPPPPTLPPQTSVGPLDCGDDIVDWERVGAVGNDFESFAASGEALISELPGVSSYERSDPSSLVWYGYDDTGLAIGVVAFQDLAPEWFKVYTCP